MSAQVGPIEMNHGEPMTRGDVANLFDELAVEIIAEANAIHDLLVDDEATRFYGACAQMTMVAIARLIERKAASLLVSGEDITDD